MGPIIDNNILVQYKCDEPCNPKLDLSNAKISRVNLAAFCHIKNLEEIHLPEATKVDDLAFIDCPNLRKVFIGSEVITDESKFANCPRKELKPLESFNEIYVNEIKGRYFLIPDYQRGYKWGENEIFLLLNDLIEAKEKNIFYPLQPLVVRNMDKDSRIVKICYNFYSNQVDQKIKEELVDKPFVEVIDGQQRLTTIMLILSRIEFYLNGNENVFPYDIFYENPRFSDKRYTNDAQNFIDSWFCSKKWITKDNALKNRSDAKSSVEDLKRYILDNVFFFYYEIASSSNESGEDLFNDINSAIKLTNAELFKARLFKQFSGISEKDIGIIEKIAYEWDQTERRLNDDDFWSFVVLEKYSDRTRIDLLLDVFAKYIILEDDGVQKVNARDPLFSYLVLINYWEKLKNQEKLPHIEIVKKIWDKILDVFAFFLRMYNDYDLYHYVGFLNHSELNKNNLDFAILYKNYKCSKFDKFKHDIYNDIASIFKEIDIESLNFERDKTALRDVFLYFNIWETMQNKRMEMRFPFRAHRNAYILIDGQQKKITWQIEHINPRSADKIDRSLNMDDVAKAYLLPDSDAGHYDYARLQKEIADKKNDVDVRFNHIYNLCLLDSYTNQTYSDSPFSVKRSFIIRFNLTNTYVPISTVQVFLKAIDDKRTLEEIKGDTKITKSDFWTYEDQEKYVARIHECFSFDEKKEIKK